MIENDPRHLKTVDSNEPECVRKALLATGWFQQRLLSADYMFYTSNFKRVGIERKTVPDLLNDLGDKLSSKFLRMTEFFDFNILLVEGLWSHVNYQFVTDRGIARWDWCTVWNFLQTWQDKGFTIQRTANWKHTVLRLNEIYAYYQKNVHTGGITRETVGDPRILALMCSGIGERLGKALLDRFGNLRAIANATVDDFLDVNKIGKIKAEALYRHFNNAGVNQDNENGK